MRTVRGVVRVPEFIKEVVWSCYPPRYRQLADRKFGQSVKYMSKVLAFALLVAGVLLLPKLALMPETVRGELGNFNVFRVGGNVSQSAPVAVPHRNPWLVVDLNSNVTLTEEVMVVDGDDVQYRLFGIKSMPLEQLKNPAGHVPAVSGFVTAMIFLLLPGVVLLLFIRMWLKYFLLLVLAAVVFFVVLELTKFRLRWKQMLSIAAHALTAVIVVEVIVGSVAAVVLVPLFRFVGVNVYALTLVGFAALMVMGVVGYHIGDFRKK